MIGVIIKRAFDIALSIVLLILLSPIMLMSALVILITMGRPIVFGQKRPGMYAKIITVYKFRTMTFAKDEDDNLKADVMRVTKLGYWLRKLSMDELPQLFNVLIGNLSFVGPRPLLIEYLSIYSSEQARRHNVKPGITGWAQVNGRNNISWKLRLVLDVWYVDNHSLRLDFKIILLTIKKVLQQSDIGQGNTMFVDKFNGHN